MHVEGVIVFTAKHFAAIEPASNCKALQEMHT